MPAKIYTDKDADLAALKGKTLAVLGFGSQGHAHALNLKDSGCKVIIGLYPGSKSRKVAEDYGFPVHDTAEAVKLADVIMVGIPDTKQAAAYEKDIGPNLAKGKTLLFTHGFSIHFKTVVPAEEMSTSSWSLPRDPVTSCADSLPRARACRLSSLSIRTPARTLKRSPSLGPKAIGGTRGGVIQTTFKEETETDLFGEQTVLCGGASALVQAGFETLVEAGYSPEMAYFECLHELKLIVDLMNESGIAGMRFSISETAKWGDVSIGPKIIDASVKKTDEGRPQEHPERQVREGVDQGIRGWLQALQRPPQGRRKASDRESRRPSSRADALDQEEEYPGRAGCLLSRNASDCHALRSRTEESPFPADARQMLRRLARSAAV